jgi:hypothetical protein
LIDGYGRRDLAVTERSRHEEHLAPRWVTAAKALLVCVHGQKEPEFLRGGFRSIEMERIRGEFIWPEHDRSPAASVELAPGIPVDWVRSG